jgi:hypothetical protein
VLPQDYAAVAREVEVLNEDDAAEMVLPERCAALRIAQFARLIY